MVPSDIGHANDDLIGPIRNGIDYGDLGILAPAKSRNSLAAI